MADNWQRQRKERMCCRMTTMTKASVPRRWSKGLNTRITCPVRRSWQRNGAATCACTCTMQTEHRSGCSTARQAWRRAISTLSGLKRTCREILLPSIMKAEPRYTPISMMHGATARLRQSAVSDPIFMHSIIPSVTAGTITIPNSGCTTCRVGIMTRLLADLLILMDS